MKRTTRATTRRAATDCADKLRILSDTTRLAILRALLAGPQRVSEINAGIEIEQSLLSHHLRILREAGMVECQRDGKAVIYRLAPDTKVDAARPGIQLGCCVLSFS